MHWPASLGANIQGHLLGDITAHIFACLQHRPDALCQFFFFDALAYETTGAFSQSTDDQRRVDLGTENDDWKAGPGEPDFLQQFQSSTARHYNVEQDQFPRFCPDKGHGLVLSGCFVNHRVVQAVAQHLLDGNPQQWMVIHNKDSASLLLYVRQCYRSYAMRTRMVRV